VSAPTPEQLHAHPQLATLLALSAQLDLVPAVLASAHARSDRDARADQARSLGRVSQIMADQIRAYVGLLEVEGSKGGSRRSK